MKTLLTIILIKFASAEVLPILDVRAIDKRINPCDNFYRFACQAWIENTQIPGSKTQVSRSASLLEDSIEKEIIHLLENVPAKYQQNLGKFYKSCLINNSQEQKIYLQKLNQIEEIKSLQELGELLGDYHHLGVDLFFFAGPVQDANDSHRVILDLSQSGMALGPKDYYLETTPKILDIREKYIQHLENLFILTGQSAKVARFSALSVLNIETYLASQALSLVESSDPKETDHLMPVEDLYTLAPDFPWSLYLKKRGIRVAQLNVSAPRYLQNFNGLFSKFNFDQIKSYIKAQLIFRSAPYMKGRYFNEYFSFWKIYLHGQKNERTPEQKCAQFTQDELGQVLVEPYSRLFDGEAIKAKTLGMIAQIKEAFAQGLEELTWLDSPTMEQALLKLKSMKQKVGAPLFYLNLDKLGELGENFLSNSFRISQFNSQRELSKIGKPVDRNEWTMMPWEVNAYYDASNNEFVFPFGILRPPSLDLNASDGANLGSFGGGTIGHELTHGFDNYGSQFDEKGNLRDWWSSQTRKLFKEKTQCFIEQANNFLIPEINQNVQGEQTLPENLSDQGGVRLGYLALEKIAKDPASEWQGYNERQQYWIAYAQSWCTKYTPETLRDLIISDEHPPAEFRVNGVLMNRPEFARDFNCPIGSKMSPFHRCQIW